MIRSPPPLATQARVSGCSWVQGCWTYLGFQQAIKGLMVWWVWSMVRASRSQWRAHSWRKRGSLQRQREGAQGHLFRKPFTETSVGTLAHR